MYIYEMVMSEKLFAFDLIEESFVSTISISWELTYDNLNFSIWKFYSWENQVQMFGLYFEKWNVFSEKRL